MRNARAVTCFTLIAAGLLAAGVGCGSGSAKRSSGTQTNPDPDPKPDPNPNPTPIPTPDPIPASSTCGDGKVDRGEMCDDGNRNSGDGCSACMLEAGWACPPGEPCKHTTCGDGVIEGWEQCDDRNGAPFDGCSAKCKRELDCTKGECVGFCGDGIVAAGEECDDGNSVDGDGCSKGCKLETDGAWECKETTSALPDAIDVQVVFRDFRGSNESGPVCPIGLGPFPELLAQGCAHPDFELSGGEQLDLLLPDMATTAGRPNVLMPVYNVAHQWYPIRTADTFAQWYADVPGVNRTTISTLRLLRAAGSNTYAIEQGGSDANQFFPLDTVPTTCVDGKPCAWGLSPNGKHDFGFTSETRYQFTYQGGEVLTFSGDDDVWVFIGGKLAVDIGGIHAAVTKSITLDDAAATRLGLVKGHIYEMALFHAERHVEQSNFTLTLAGFIKNTTVCTRGCGNGKLDPGEQCDLGDKNGKGSGCSATCQMVGEW